jgi:hypothetical protein
MESNFEKYYEFEIVNIYNHPLKIYSDIEEINKMNLNPDEKIRIKTSVEPGMKLFTNSISLHNKSVAIYVGVIDEEW